MPELTPDALRAAVAQLLPSRLPEFSRHLSEAATNAQKKQSLAPLRMFVHSWAVTISIERHPERAARLHELERAINTGEAGREAATEIRLIWEAAEAEAGL
ncbi:DUF6247 family protein [Streptomyces stramineus]|uniref:Uncharacterized protein n=1 Tax=Streptomyces stramineus TaxID=173861 RepID=A0ABN1AEE0_9ACTN